MALQLKAICNSKKARRDGTSIVSIQYCYSSENRTLLNTGIAIPASYWHKKKQAFSEDLPVEFGIPQILEEELLRQKRLAEDIILYANKNGIKDRLAFVTKLFDPQVDMSDIDTLAKTKCPEFFNDNKNNLEFFFQIKDFIASKERKVCPGMIKVYEHMRDHLKAFETANGLKITFNSLDYNFYECFIDFLSFEYEHSRRKEKLYGLKINTIGLTIKHLRGFVRDRVRRKIIAPIDMSDFKIPEEENDAIYLTTEEINKLYNLDLSEQPFLEPYRDLFVLACLSGLRFSDFSVLKVTDLRGNLLYKKQGKSEHWVVIPLRPKAREVFLRQFSGNIFPNVTNAEFNRHIKTLGRLADINEKITFSYKKGNKTIETTQAKYNWITTHTGRRSFCTNEFLAGTPVKLIMKISGHKTEKDFYKYIRITAEEAARKIQELWIERGEIDESYKSFIT